MSYLRTTVGNSHIIHGFQQRPGLGGSCWVLLLAAVSSLFQSLSLGRDFCVLVGFFLRSNTLSDTTG